MRNRFEVHSDIAIIHLNDNGACRLITIVDASKLEKLARFDMTWFAYFDSRARKYYVKGNVPVDGNRRHRKGIALHRVLTDAPEGMVVDHINGQSLDNRLANLRVVTQAANNQNPLGGNRGTSSRFRGVTWNKRLKKWCATVMRDGKLHHLGCYEDEEEAGRVAANARARLLPYSREATGS